MRCSRGRVLGWWGAAAGVCVALVVGVGVRRAAGGTGAKGPPTNGPGSFAQVAGRRALSGRLIVRPVSLESRRRALGPAAAAAADARARARLAPQAIEHVVATDEYIVRVPRGRTDAAYAQTLLATRDYAYVEPDWRLTPARTPNDPLEPQQWQHARILAPQAWDLTVGVPSVLCAVCDTGVDLSHPDLAPVLVEGGFAAGLGPVVPQSEGGNVSDVNGHGTLVSGCLAAAGNNGIGVAGCGWDLRLMPVRVSDQPDGSAFLSDITKGARWAAEHGARVINCSYEGVSSESVEENGQYIKSLGGLLFWAAGNYAQDWTTFDHEDVVVVGATTETDEKAAFSAFGPGVDVFAPGVGVYTTALGGGYASVDGTSFASAIAAGVAGLVWSENGALSPDEVQQILYATCDDLGEAGDDAYWGWGRVDALHAVEESVPPDTPPGPFMLLGPPNFAADVSATPHLEWSESSEAGFYRVLVDDDPTFGSPEIDALVLDPSLDVASGQLAYETTYEWTVVAENLLGAITFDPEVASFTTGPMPPPGTFAVVEPAPGATGVSTGPSLSWGVAALADSYHVVVSENADLSDAIVDETVSSPQTIVTLSAGTLVHDRMYHWVVTATNDAGEQSTPEQTFTTAPPPPPSPFSLLAPENGAAGVPSGATFAWTASAGAERYVVEVALSTTFDAPVVSQTVEAPEIAAVLEPETLAGSTLYFWRVRAENGSGEQISSPTVSAFTTAPPPGCTGDLNGDGVTDIFDFANLALGFGTTSGATRRQGDLNGDGSVNALDFGIFAIDFGCRD